jgi:hypothetical protein
LKSGFWSMQVPLAAPVGMIADFKVKLYRS